MPRPLIVVGGGVDADRVEAELAEAGHEVVRAEADSVSRNLGRLKPSVLLVELASGAEGRRAAEALTQRIQATAYGAVLPVMFFGPAPGPNPAEVVGMGGDLFLPMPAEPGEIRACVKRLGGELVPGPSATATPAGAPASSSPAVDELAPPRTDAPVEDAPAAHGTPAPGAEGSLAGTPAPTAAEDSEHLRVLDDLPWAGMPDMGDIAPQPLPDLDAPGGLADIMAGDAALDPLALARQIAAGAPSTSPPETAAPPGPEPNASEGEAGGDTGVGAPEPPVSSASRAPEINGDDPSEIEALLGPLSNPGGDSDTVAVRIKKTISAFEEQISVPEDEGADERLDSRPGTPTSHPGTPASRPGTPTSRPGTPASRPGTSLPESRAVQTAPGSVYAGAGTPQPTGTPRPATLAPGPAAAPRLSEQAAPDDDGIDLDALDIDTIAGVDTADPNGVIDRLDEEYGTPAPPSGGAITHVGSTASGAPLSVQSFANLDLSTSRAGVGSIPGPVTGSLPGTPSGSARLPPLPRPEGHLASPGSEEQDAEPTRVPAAPLASPYDLPPVVGGQDRAPTAMERGFHDGVDTVPGRRTAIIGEVKQRPLHEDSAEDADVTQPAQPKSRRKRSGEDRASAGTPTSQVPPEDGTVTPPPRPDFGPPAGRDAPAPPIPASLRSGHLDSLDAARLFWQIGEHRLTGTLTVDLPDGRMSVWLQDGMPRFAHSTRPEDRMLEMLQRRGQISAAQRAEVEQEMTASGRRAGALLLDRGWIKSAELIPTIRDHLADLVFTLFAAERGDFRLTAERPAQDEIVHLDLRPAALVLEGVRRKYTPERIARLAGATDLTPVRRPDADEGLLAGAALTGQDWRIIDAMDGRRTVEALAEKLEAPAHRVWALAWALSCMELVALSRADAGRAGHASRHRDSDDADFEVEVKRLLGRHATLREGDYFACLGAAPSATAHEIEEAYQRSRAQFDPDRLHPGVATRYAAELAEVRAVLDEAFTILSDPRLRERYRRFLAPPTPRSKAPAEPPSEGP